MLPEIWEIPIIHYPVRSFGLMLMIGFLSAVYLASRRAEKVKADPDFVINTGFAALIGGVLGARLFYVLHYWERDFAGRTSPLLAIIDITHGGMEFYGGVIGAFVFILAYLIMTRKSIRLYLDILTPGIMWGLAFGRIGCFLNGCCWGAVCAGTVAENWSVQFPYASPAYIRQYENRQLKVPAPLLAVGDNWSGPISRELIASSVTDLKPLQTKVEAAKQKLESISNQEQNPKRASKVKKQVQELEEQLKRAQLQNRFLENNLEKYPSKQFPGEHMTPSELTELASAHRSLPVHPTQLYSSINAMLASIFLAFVFRYRRRHGMVFAIWLMTYPITRFIIEIIRADNPRDTFTLTISQFISLGLVLSGVAMMLILRRMPEQSPAARAWEPPKEESKNAKGQKPVQNPRGS